MQNKFLYKLNLLSEKEEENFQLNFFLRLIFFKVGILEVKLWKFRGFRESEALVH